MDIQDTIIGIAIDSASSPATLTDIVFATRCVDRNTLIGRQQGIAWQLQPPDGVHSWQSVSTPTPISLGLHGVAITNAGSEMRMSEKVEVVNFMVIVGISAGLKIGCGFES